MALHHAHLKDRTRSKIEHVQHVKHAHRPAAWLASTWLASSSCLMIASLSRERRRGAVSSLSRESGRGAHAVTWVASRFPCKHMHPWHVNRAWVHMWCWMSTVSPESLQHQCVPRVNPRPGGAARFLAAAVQCHTVANCCPHGRVLHTGDRC